MPIKLSGWEILIIIIVLVLVFGAAKLPSIASSVGKSMKVFKKEVKELRDEDKPEQPETTPAPPTTYDQRPQQSSYDATKDTDLPSPPTSTRPDDQPRQ